MSPLKALLVDAVCGNPVPRSLIIAMNGEDCELFKSTGNQWNESYAWKRESLEKMTLDQLDELYAGIKFA
jgi:hypothetical protein